MKDYVIEIWVRRFRWLPWPLTWLQFEKRTTWREAHHIAIEAAEAGAQHVVVYERAVGK